MKNESNKEFSQDVCLNEGKFLKGLNIIKSASIVFSMKVSVVFQNVYTIRTATVNLRCKLKYDCMATNIIIL